jgi:NitT/TauT family transport system substrate-binding protein
MPFVSFRSLAAIVVSVLVLSASAAFGQTSGRTAITVTTTSPSDTLPFFYAVKNGLFEKAGLDVTVQASTSGSSSILAVVGGAAQFGYANNLSLSAAHLKGIPVQMVAPGGEYTASAPFAKMLVLGDSGIKTAKDLEGKIVAVTGLHDLLSLSARAWIDKNGGDPANVKFVEIPPGAMLAALQQKRVDAIANFEPYVSAAEAAGARPIGAPYDAVSTHFMTACWFGNSDWIKEHHEAALRFAQVINQAQAYTNPHYTELVPFIAEYSKLPVETLRKMPIVHVPASMSAALVQPLIDTAAKYKELPQSFPAKDEILAGVP